MLRRTLLKSILTLPFLSKIKDTPESPLKLGDTVKLKPNAQIVDQPNVLLEDSRIIMGIPSYYLDSFNQDNINFSRGKLVTKKSIRDTNRIVWGVLFNGKTQPYQINLLPGQLIKIAEREDINQRKSLFQIKDFVRVTYGPTYKEGIVECVIKKSNSRTFFTDTMITEYLSEDFTYTVKTGKFPMHCVKERDITKIA
ncbi:hypothetical protein LCGC14_1287520 [marine sediment metagenome]|uniref:Uncharacterized protein n=1 Tax=marine sediment metagenome TaxID=412755 RepID=A0A0F9NWB9_9ZZZZ